MAAADGENMLVPQRRCLSLKPAIARPQTVALTNRKLATKSLCPSNVYPGSNRNFLQSSIAHLAFAHDDATCVRPCGPSVFLKTSTTPLESDPLTQTTRRCGTIDERIFISVTKCHKKSYNITALPPALPHSRRSASSLHSSARLLHPAAQPPTPTPS